MLQLSKQVCAVYQQVMGEPFPSDCSAEVGAEKKHQQQLHWEYAIQLLKDLEGLLPIRIHAAHIVSFSVCAFANTAHTTVSQATCERSEEHTSELQSLMR